MLKVRLKAMPYAQARVHIIEGGVNLRCALVSYTTVAAQVIEGGWLIVNGLYSATTRKHLGAFAKEYCGADYSIIKKCYNEELAYNIHDRIFMDRNTGEVFEL